MAEVHLVGCIEGGEDFDHPALLCKWGIITDDGRHDSKRWNLLEGIASGQTQVDIAQDGNMSVWSFPLDLHYSTTTIHGWPKFTCEVWAHDKYGRNCLAGYGMCHIPTMPGIYELSVCTWRPKPQSWLEYINGFFLGAYPQLKNPDVVWRQVRFRRRMERSDLVAWGLGMGVSLCRMLTHWSKRRSSYLQHWKEDRFRLSTVTSGRVLLRVSVITMGFEKHGVTMSNDGDAT